MRQSEPNFVFYHFGMIFIHSESIIGRNCTIRQGVTVGNTKEGGQVPVIGDHVELGASLLGFRRLSRLRVWRCLTRIKPNIAKKRPPNRRFPVICQLLLTTDSYCNDSASRSSTARLLRTTLGPVFAQPPRKVSTV